MACAVFLMNMQGLDLGLFLIFSIAHWLVRLIPGQTSLRESYWRVVMFRGAIQTSKRLYHHLPCNSGCLKCSVDMTLSLDTNSQQTNMQYPECLCAVQLWFSTLTSAACLHHDRSILVSTSFGYSWQEDPNSLSVPEFTKTMCPEVFSPLLDHSEK